MVEWIPDQNLHYFEPELDYSDDENEEKEVRFDVSYFPEILDLSQFHFNQLQQIVNEFIDHSILFGRKRVCLIYNDDDSLSIKAMIDNFLKDNRFVREFNASISFGSWKSIVIQLA